MKSYSALAGRYLKQQRKRSVLTVIGIILSVALISALGTMGHALKDNVLRQTMYEQGSYHFGYNEPEGDLFERLRNNVLLDRVGLVRQGEGTTLTNAEVRLYQGNADLFSIFPIHLQSGRFPSKPGEVVVEEWALSALPGKPAIGGKAELKTPDGDTESFSIVGILANQRSSQINGTSDAYGFLTEDDANRLVKEGKATTLIATFKTGVNINSHLSGFEQLNPSKFFTNIQLLALMGESADNNVNKAIFLIFGILIGLVVVSTIAVIYNAFHISVLERIRQFGLLRTIGATPGQIRSLVFREASTLVAIGMPIGLAVGWGTLWLVLWLMKSAGITILQMEDFQLTFHWWIMGISVLVGLVSVYLAAWMPARKASRVSPVDAVKGAGSIVRESYRRSLIPSPLSLLGVEGRMAKSNIRRNRTKFRITTFSIVIGIVLFIVFHYFTQEMFKYKVQANETDNVSFQLSKSYNLVDEGDDVLSPSAVDELKKIPGIDAVYGRYLTLSGKALVPENKLPSDLRFEERKTQLSGKEVYSNDALLYLYDDARLEASTKFLTSGSIDPAAMAAEDGVLIVQTANIKNEIKKINEIRDITSYKVGDSISLDTVESETANKDGKAMSEVKVAGILSKAPFGNSYMQDASLVVIASKSTYGKWAAQQPVPGEGDSKAGVMLGAEIALKDGADVDLVRDRLNDIVLSTPGLRMIDIVTEQKNERQFNLQMSIFIYGFLAVIILIGSLNIVNTVQTNLLLRRREFGLLKAVGMTDKQARYMASIEGVWYGVIGSFWGLLIGGGLCYLLYLQIGTIQGIPFEFPWVGALLSCGFALIVGLLSVQGPLTRMARSNTIEQLREE